MLHWLFSALFVVFVVRSSYTKQTHTPNTHTCNYNFQLLPIPYPFACTHIKCSVWRKISVWILQINSNEDYFYIFILCICITRCSNDINVFKVALCHVLSSFTQFFFCRLFHYILAFIWYVVVKAETLIFTFAYCAPNRSNLFEFDYFSLLLLLFLLFIANIKSRSL